jgi:hypothetical protein
MSGTPHLYAIRGTREFHKEIKREAVQNGVTIEEFLRMAVQALKAQSPA